ncbi:hypothetical protein M3J09_006332 [Ascochyta lentis]
MTRTISKTKVFTQTKSCRDQRYYPDITF